MTDQDKIFTNSLVELQQKFANLGQLDKAIVQDEIYNLIRENETLSHTSPTQAVLDDIKTRMNNSDRAKTFFASAFTNWYRSSDLQTTTNLSEFDNLDATNQNLFFEMMRLRKHPNFDDEALYQFEQYCYQVCPELRK